MLFRSSAAARVKDMIKSLPSGYNRDFQDTKEPLMEGVNATLELVRIMDLMTQKLEVYPENLIKACTPELYATDKVMDSVLNGGNFRDSYKNVGLNLDKVEKDADPVASMKRRTVIGSAGNLRIEVAESYLKDIEAKVAERVEFLESIYTNLVPSVKEVIL